MYGVFRKLQAIHFRGRVFTMQPGCLYCGNGAPSLVLCQDHEAMRQRLAVKFGEDQSPKAKAAEHSRGLTHVTDFATRLPYRDSE
jgi:hypothetical protein